MSEHELPPLDDDIRALLRGARGPFPVPSGADARVLAAVEALVLPSPGGGGAPPPPGGGAGAGALAGLRKLLPLAGTFLIGGAVGAGVVRATLHAPPPVVVQGPERIVYVQAPAPSASAIPEPAAAPAASASAKVATAAASAGELGGLAAERALLDVARGALERGDGAAALAATRDHERRFPGGMLVQEREAMAIRALSLLGRPGEAHARLERFRARFPGSVLLPTLEAQLGASPSTP